MEISFSIEKVTLSTRCTCDSEFGYKVKVKKKILGGGVTLIIRLCVGYSNYSQNQTATGW